MLELDSNLFYTIYTNTMTEAEKTTAVIFSSSSEVKEGNWRHSVLFHSPVENKSHKHAFSIVKQARIILCSLQEINWSVVKT